MTHNSCSKKNKMNTTINNPIVHKINEHLLKLRKKRMKIQSEPLEKVRLSKYINSLQTFLGELDRYIRGKDRPDLSDDKIKGLFRNYLSNLIIVYDNTHNNDKKNDIYDEINFLRSLNVIVTKMSPIEIRANVQKLINMRKNDENFIKASNKKHIIELEFYKLFIPTAANAEEVNQILSKYFENEK